ncbi:MAG: hypothetical protein JSS56_25160 [Proteobacteria bacterium]|nr:hypothetical protein [Pseudomonadota bacterium]
MSECAVCGGFYNERCVHWPQCTPVREAPSGGGYAELRAAAAEAQVNEMAAALREAYIALAFAFNRIHVLPRTRDTELANSIEKVRAKIAQVMKAGGHKL